MKPSKRKYENKILNIAYNDGYQEAKQEFDKKLEQLKEEIYDLDKYIGNYPYQLETTRDYGKLILLIHQKLIELKKKIEEMKL